MPDTELQEIIELLRKINTKQESKVKSWVSILSNLLSGVVLAGAALYINSSFQEHQLEMQTRLQKVQILKDFIPYIGDSNAAKNSAVLYGISSLGYDSLAIALGYGLNNKVAKDVFENKVNSTSGDKRKLYEDALKILKTVTRKAEVLSSDPQQAFNANNIYRNCKIIEFTSNISAQGNGIVHHFKYDLSTGNPIEVTSNSVGTGNPNLSFRFDKKGRLIEYRGDYTNGLYEFKHTYGYSGENITTDTVFFPIGSGRIFTYSYLSYDKYGRVIKDSSVTRRQGSVEITDKKVHRFSYDLDGNLILEGVHYDNRVSILRTNKIWMFLSRNYSISNPFYADQYNLKDFPTHLTQTKSFNFLYGMFGGPFDIKYECTDE